MHTVYNGYIFSQTSRTEATHTAKPDITVVNRSGIIHVLPSSCCQWTKCDGYLWETTKTEVPRSYIFLFWQHKQHGDQMSHDCPSNAQVAGRRATLHLGCAMHVMATDSTWPVSCEGHMDKYKLLPQASVLKNRTLCGNVTERGALQQWRWRPTQLGFMA